MLMFDDGDDDNDDNNGDDDDDDDNNGDEDVDDVDDDDDDDDVTVQHIDLALGILRSLDCFIQAQLPASGVSHQDTAGRSSSS
jgi:hypothetical protein